MKYLKSYNEGIISSAMELVNRSKEIDTKAQKYIQMIYDDWNKHKDLYRISIRENDGYTMMEYLITTGDQNDVQIGNRDEDSITIELTYIDNILAWSSDKTKGRIEVTKFKSYLGDLCVFGRMIKSGKIIDNINGTKEDEGKSGDAVSYVNVSSGPIKKIIKFFISEFKKKYPTIEKSYGKRKILEISKVAREENKISSKAKADREKSKFEKEIKEETEFIRSKLASLKMERDNDILDYFVELEDEVKIDIDYKRSIYIGDSVYTASYYDLPVQEFLHNSGLVSKFSLNSSINRNKYKFTEESIPLEKDIPYHRIIIKLLDNEYDVEKFKTRVEKIIKRLGFGLKVEASNFSDRDRDGFNKEYGISFLELQGGWCGYVGGALFNESSSAIYLFYLKEI